MARKLVDGYAELYLAGFARVPMSQDLLPADATPATRRLTEPERLQAYYNGLNDAGVMGHEGIEPGKTAELTEALQADGDDAIMKIKKTLSLEEAERDEEARKESREAFHARRATGIDGDFEIFAEGETVAYGYARCAAVQASTAGDILEELSALGIQGDVMDGVLLKNRDGITTQEKVEDAATIGRRRVLVNAATHDIPKNVAGHEAFHVWNGTDATAAFREAIQENLKYTSPEFLAFQKWISVQYFGKEVELADEQKFRNFQEELFAYIAGGIHDGVNDDRLRPMFRDFEAVKAAWEALVKSQTSATGAMDTAHPRESAGDIQRIYSRPPQSADDAQAMGQGRIGSSADESALQSAEEKGAIESTSEQTGKQAARYPGGVKPPKLSKQEWRQVQAAQMQKYGGMEEGEIPERGYVFAHDKFYIIRNYGAGSFKVGLRLDPGTEQQFIRDYLEGEANEDNEGIGP